MRTSKELVEIQHRLEAAGIKTVREEGVACCYARQTKFRVTDPDRALWEIYIFHDDIDDDHHDHDEAHDRGDEPVLVQVSRTSTPAVAALRSSWAHHIQEGRARAHGLSGDAPCPRAELALPGPAAAVQYVPTLAEIA